MTPERARELLPIITAFSEGKRIEWLDDLTNTWIFAENQTWLDNFRYRIAPEQPKKKVKMWQALMRSDLGSFTSSDYYFTSEEKAKIALGKSFVMLLPHTEIEVEVDDE